MGRYQERSTGGVTVQLISDFGFSGQSLRAVNSILPIAYYLYMKNPGESYLTHSSYETDRQKIRKWISRSLLKSGIWGSGLDTLLTALRQVIRKSGSNSFPVTQIREEMARRGKSLTFEDEEIEDLLRMLYGHHLTFALLSLLFSFVDLRIKFHVDHIFPKARFTQRQLNDAGVPENKINSFISRQNGLANLQLLEGAQNSEKHAKMPADWLSQTHSDPESRRAYEDRHLLGHVPESITEFDTFYNARRSNLKARIKELLGR